MRTDRELLELAAKAAGAKNISFASGELALHNPFGETGNCFWNPLVNDGDALRLAAELDLFGDPSYWHWLAIARLSNSTDKHANVRRAIVRAAAELGAHPKQHNDGGQDA